MLKRIIALSLFVLLSVGVYLPFANSNAHGVRQSSQIRQRRHSRLKSRAWWRRYRARLRKKRAAAAELAHKAQMLTLPANLNLGNFVTVNPSEPIVPAIPADGSVRPRIVGQRGVTNSPKAIEPFAVAPVLEAGQIESVVVKIEPKVETTSIMANARIVPLKTKTPRVVPAVPKIGGGPVAPILTSTPVVRTTTATLLTGSVPTLINAPIIAPPAKAPATRVKAATEARPVNETRIVPKNPVSPLPGELSISVVALSRPNPAFLTAREEARLLAGIPVADLRRIVIDRMVLAGGWVTNDFVREINGGRVLVVTARTPRDGQTPEKNWTFYFTESGGRIYSLTTDSPVEHSQRMAKEAERFIGTLRSTTTEKE